MRLFVIAGEKSGDQHAARVIEKLKAYSKECEIQAYGGDEMEQAGAMVLKKYHDIAFMGLDFVFSIRKVLKVFSNCKADILNFKPDALLFVDFSGFNLRIAHWAFIRKIPCYYYIPPKTWAWNEGRNRKLRLFMNKVYAILPFEEEYFKTHLVDAEYVGNPSKEAFMAVPKVTPTTAKYIALLPGSRMGELKRIIPLLNKVIAYFPKQDFKVAALTALGKDIYSEFEGDNVSFEWDQADDVLHNSSVAVVTSGTATLETALLKIPQVVVYKASTTLYPLLKSLVKAPYISLVNLILQKEAVKEFIQDDYKEQELYDEINDLILSSEKRETMLQSYTELDKILGDLKPSEVVANDLLNEMQIIQIPKNEN